MKAKLLYLLIATIVLTTALFITHQAGIIQSQAAAVERAVHLQAVELEREKTQAELDQQTEQLRQVEERNAELEEMLINRAHTYEIVTTGIQLATARESDVQLLSRSGRQELTAVNMSVQSRSGFTAAVYERAFQAYGAANLYGLGEALVAAEEEYSVNSLILAAIVVHESAWGRSAIAQDKNNLAGLGAYDGSAYKSAFTFDSKADSIFALAKLLCEQYLTPGGHSANGDNLQAVSIRYASDPAWARKVGAVMGFIARAAVEDPGELMAAAEVDATDEI